MSNRAVLLNTSVLTSNPFALARDLDKPGNSYAEVAEASYAIPIPWFFCFKADDLQMVTVELDEDEDEDEEAIEVGLPCTTVAEAIENMSQALPHFEAIAGDPALGKAYWQNAMVALNALPLPYLTMNPLEIMFMGDPLDYAEEMAQAFEGDAAAIAQIKNLAGYTDGIAPYTPDVAEGRRGAGLDDVRLANSVALHGSFHAAPG
ncbi:hypothetical protein [Massilia genomosp. 1]|uniref:hypothetical protein n=1 Tax=Massilia genomosp. 1 TaxID=2609280 RepID=UPI00142145A8|nr:hypothetical protein [Massilia genomosp. 1]